MRVIIYKGETSLNLPKSKHRTCRRKRRPCFSEVEVAEWRRKSLIAKARETLPPPSFIAIGLLATIGLRNSCMLSMDLTTPSGAASASRLLTNADSGQPTGKLRAACNRCHAQKLRCVKQTGHASCDRCLRLKTSCHFGFRAPRSSLKLSNHVTQHLDDGQDLLDLSQCSSTSKTCLDDMTAGAGKGDWQFLPTMSSDISLNGGG